MTQRQKLKERMEAKRKEALVKEIAADFAQRRAARRMLERGWELNMNFVSGNQFCDITLSGELEEEAATFYWQSRRCFNHIAPTLDTRLARLAKVRPSLEVRAFSDADDDMKTARLCTSILRSVKDRIDLDGIISQATLWSETCGTSFYKVVWNHDDGKVIGTNEAGHSVREGDVNVVPLSPFEVYPDTLTAENMQEVSSLIHAKAVPTSYIRDKFGVEVAGGDVGDFPLLPYSAASGWKRPADGGERPVLVVTDILPVYEYEMCTAHTLEMQQDCRLSPAFRQSESPAVIADIVVLPRHERRIHRGEFIPAAAVYLFSVSESLPGGGNLYPVPLYLRQHFRQILLYPFLGKEEVPLAVQRKVPV